MGNRQSYQTVIREVFELLAKKETLVGGVDGLSPAQAGRRQELEPALAAVKLDIQTNWDDYLTEMFQLYGKTLSVSG